MVEPVFYRFTVYGVFCEQCMPLIIRRNPDVVPDSPCSFKTKDFTPVGHTVCPTDECWNCKKPLVHGDGLAKS